MLTQGNQKLGSLIWGWSIPTLDTCPGASEVCELLCYARRGHFRHQRVKDALATNWQATKTAEFAPWMIQQIHLNSVTICRIHVAGDFYDRQYIQRWLRVVARCRRTVFYAYTRSWHKPRLLDALVALSREPNFSMYFSWDRSMPFPPRRKGIRTCYLSQDDNDFPRRMTDLVFRDNPKQPMKHDPVGNLICPYDNGVTRMDCSRCGICWTKQVLNGTRNLRRRSARADRPSLAGHTA